MSPEEETVINRNTMKLQEHLYKELKQRDQYKAERDTLIDDISVLKANISRLERENKSQQSVIEQFKHDLQYTEWEIVPALKQQNKQQTVLLKEFSKFINYKLYVCPANDTYKHYRRELDKLGVK